MSSLKSTRGPFTHLLCICLALSVSAGPLLARPLNPVEAPSPRAMFTQMEDPDLVRELSQEETLEQLQDMEYDRESLSLGRGVTLSLIPGGGFGLLYAGERAQGLLVIALSTVGYVLGIAYASGSMNSEQSEVCVYKKGTPEEDLVQTQVCGWWDGQTYPNRYNSVDPRSVDPVNNPEGQKYFQTKTNYTLEQRGEQYDGQGLGLKILIGTYLTSTLIGAIWSGDVILDHNDEVRKRVESTAGLFPVIHTDGDGTTVGLGLRF